MLEQLQLQHFKGHEQLDIVFTPGLNLITGLNYTGKSTILHGVLFAFFGVPAVPGGSRIVPQRGGKPSDTKVIAQFYHDRETYRIIRKVTSAKLYRGKQLIATSVSAVNRELEGIFNIPQKFFMRLKYAEQGETQALLTLGISELHRIMEHVSGASLVNRIIERASKCAAAAQSKIEVLGPSPDLDAIAIEEETRKQELHRLYSDLKRQLGESQRIQSAFNEAQAQFSEVTRFNARQRQLIAQRDAIDNQLLQAQNDLESAQREMAEHEALYEGSEAIEARARHLNELNQLYTQLEVDAAKLETVIKQHAHARREADDEVNRLDREIIDIGKPDTTQAVEEKAQVEAKFRALTDEIKTTSEAIKKAICPTCKRPFEGQDVDKFKQRLEELVELSNQAQEEYETKLDAAAKASNHKRRYEQAGKKRDAFILQRQNFDTWCEEAELSLAKVKEKQARLDPRPKREEVVAALEQARDAQQAVGAYRSASRVYSVAEGRVRKLRQERENLEAAQPEKDTGEIEQRLGELRLGEQRSSDQVVQVTSRYSSRYSEWQQLADTLKHEQTRLATIQQHHREKDTATNLNRYLRDNRDRFMQALWGQVTGFASNFSEMCTGGTIERIERTPEGVFQFFEEGVAARIEGASGAQKSIMAVGIQLALDTLLPDTFGALLLDEPTSQMDANHALALTQALAQSGRQIIMVSHREMDASVAQSHIHLG